METDVTWNVQHMEKLSVSIPPQEQWSEQPKVDFTLLKREKEKKLWKIVGLTR